MVKKRCLQSSSWPVNLVWLLGFFRLHLHDPITPAWFLSFVRYQQNHRQKVFTFVQGGIDILKFDKKSIDL